MARSLRYYVEVLGFTSADWGGDDFTCVTRNGASITSPKAIRGSPGPGCGPASKTSKRCTRKTAKSGATILHPPENYFWACEMKVADLDGHCTSVRLRTQREWLIAFFQDGSH